MKKIKIWLLALLLSGSLSTAACGRVRQAEFAASDLLVTSGSDCLSVSEQTGGQKRGEKDRRPGASGAVRAAGREASGASAEDPAVSPKIWVHVCGAVERPGVYELAAGSRVYQALEEAGGLTESADGRTLNQAGLLRDGQQILVYTTEELERGLPPSLEGQTEKAAAISGTDRVNLNTAGREELMSLPGIGEARADAILSYREREGRFLSIEDIRRVPGIKDKAFEKIKSLIEV